MLFPVIIHYYMEDFEETDLEQVIFTSLTVSSVEWMTHLSTGTTDQGS